MKREEFCSNYANSLCPDPYHCDGTSSSGTIRTCYTPIIPPPLTPNDAVSHPSHYISGRNYEPKDVIRDWDLNFNLGSAVKYISRAGRKGDPIQDLRKARQFIEFEIEALEKERNINANKIPDNV